MSARFIRWWPKRLSVPAIAAEVGTFDSGTGKQGSKRNAYAVLRVWRFSVRIETPWRRA